MQDPKIFNEALEAISSSYKAYAQAKLKGWQNFTCESQQQKDLSVTSAAAAAVAVGCEAGDQPIQQPYIRPRVVLGTSSDYADHYERYLNPKLQDAHIAREANTRKYFLDFGAAPGGLCRCLLSRCRSNDCCWEGTAVTLGPSDGGLEMDEELLKFAKMEGEEGQHSNNDNKEQESEQHHFSSRLTVKYRDVCDTEKFVKACEKNGNKSEHWADFVNCGIVLDAKVKSKKTGKVIGYGEQLFIQLASAMKALRDDGEGDVMVALRFDFPSLPETIPTIDLFRQHCTKGIFILPTLYTESCGRKQFYLLARGIVMTDAFCHQVKAIWDKGRERYVNLRKVVVTAREAKKNGGGCGETRQRKDDDDDNRDDEEEKVAGVDDVEKKQVYELVQRVYQATGPTLDEFCRLIQQFLEKTLHV